MTKNEAASVAQLTDEPTASEVMRECEAFESAMVEAGYNRPDIGRHPGMYRYQRDQDRFVGWKLARARGCQYIDCADDFGCAGCAAPAAPATGESVAGTETRVRTEADIRSEAFKDCVDAIRGAIAFGQQDTNHAPTSHWLAEFWGIGRRLATPPVAKSEAASQPGEMGAGVPTECQTVFGEPCQYARDIASGRVHCIHCDRDKPASAQQVEREAFEIWATDEGLPLKLTQTEKSYLDYRTTAAWDGWQARAAQQSQVDAKQDEREALTAEFVMRALRDAIADMRAIKCDVPESASLIGYFGNRIRAAKQVQAGGEDKRIADLEADRDSWRNYVESGNYLDDKQDAERWRLVPAFLEHYNYKRLVRDIDDALSREQPQPSNGDREGGAV